MHEVLSRMSDADLVALVQTLANQPLAELLRRGHLVTLSVDAAKAEAPYPDGPMVVSISPHDDALGVVEAE